jgi:hypothetical protein
MKHTPRLSACAALVLALAFTGAASAQEEPSEGLPKLEVSVGLGNLVFGDWTQIQITASLPKGAAPFRGRLQVAIAGSQVGGCEAPFELAADSQRTLRMVVPVVKGEAFRVRLLDGEGKVVLTEEPEDDAERVDDSVAMLLAPKGLAGLDAKERKGGMHVARIDPASLPRDPRALRRLRALFVPLDESTQELIRDPKSVEVLRRYVEEGGRLVLLALREALCPVRDPRPGTLPPDRVKTLLGEIESPLPVVKSRLAPGAKWQLLLGTTDLVAELRVGEGQVAFVAFDPDGTVARSGDLVSQAVDQLAATKRSARALQDDWGLEGIADDCFQTREVLTSTGFSLLVFALVVHGLVIGPLTLVLGRRKKRPWLALLVPAALSAVLGFLILAVVALTRDEGTDARAVIMVTQAAPERAGVAHVELALFAGSPTECAIDLGGTWTPGRRERGPLQALQFRHAPPWIQVQEGAGQRISPIRIAGHGLSRWRLRGTRPRLPLRVDRAEDGTYTFAAEESLGGLWAVSLDKEARLEALAPLGQEALTWIPSAAPLFLERALPFDMDPFREEQARPLLVRRVVWRLHQTWLSQVSQGNSFPGAWLVRVEAAQAADLHVVSAGESLAVETLTLTLVPLESP